MSRGRKRARDTREVMSSQVATADVHAIVLRLGVGHKQEWRLNKRPDKNGPGSKDLDDPLDVPVRAFGRDAKRERLQVEPEALPVLLKAATASGPLEGGPGECPGEEAGEDEALEVGPSSDPEDIVGELQLSKLFVVGNSEPSAREADW